MHHNVLEDVGMHYSLSVMFHVFPVVNSKRRENMAVISKDHRYIYCTHHRDNVEKEWDSPTEVRGRRKRQLITTKTTCITTSLYVEDAHGMCYSLSVMFHVFPVMKRR